MSMCYDTAVSPSSGDVTMLLQSLPALPSLRAAKITTIRTLVGPVDMRCMSHLDHLALACAGLDLRAADGWDPTINHMGPKSLHIIAETTSPERWVPETVQYWLLRSRVEGLQTLLLPLSVQPQAGKAPAAHEGWAARTLEWAAAQVQGQGAAASGRQACHMPWTCSNTKRHTALNRCMTAAPSCDLRVAAGHWHKQVSGHNHTCWTDT